MIRFTRNAVRSQQRCEFLVNGPFAMVNLLARNVAGHHLYL